MRSLPDATILRLLNEINATNFPMYFLLFTSVVDSITISKDANTMKTKPSTKNKELKDSITNEHVVVKAATAGIARTVLGTLRCSAVRCLVAAPFGI